MTTGYAYHRDGEYSQVTLPGGACIPAVPHPTEEYEARARSLGYASGAAMSAEHDLIHILLADVFGTVSPALAAVASGQERPRSWMEEDLVKLVASRLNDPGSDDLPGGGLIRWMRGRLAEAGARAGGLSS